MSSNPPTESRQRLEEQIRTNRETKASDHPHSGKHAWQVTPRRILAFCLDYALLAILGAAVVWVFGMRLIWLSDKGHWLGFAVTLLYFGLLNSRFGNGKTVGKRLMRIEVCRTDGAPLGFAASLLRYSPFALVWIADFTPEYISPFSLVGQGLGSLAFLINLALVIFLLSHPQRRSVHDIIAGTVVVRSETPFQVQPVSVKRPIVIFAVVGVLFGTALVLSNWFLSSMPQIQKAVRMWNVIYKEPGLKSPSVLISTRKTKDSKPTKSLVVAASVSDFRDFADKRRSDEIAANIRRALVLSHEIPSDVQSMSVTLRSGYSLGLWNFTLSRNFSFPVSEDLSPQIRVFTTPGKSQMKKKKD